MKRSICILSALLIVAVSLNSCEKDQDGDDNNSLSKSWKVGDKTYKQTLSLAIPTGSAVTLTAFASMPNGDDPIDSFQVIFKSKPTTGGSYKIVYKPDYDDLNADEVYVMASVAEGDKLAVAKTEGNEGKMATVAINGGKINVTIPKVSAHYGSHNGSLNETTSIEGNIMEQ